MAMTASMYRRSLALYLLAVTASSAWSQCPGDQVACLSLDNPPLATCLERRSLCVNGMLSNCRGDVVQNLSLQCSDVPPVFMCDGKSYPLTELCTGTAQCSDESSLLCEGIPRLPFLVLGTGNSIVDLEPSLDNSIERSIAIGHHERFPFGSSTQDNLYVGTNGYFSFGTAFNLSTPGPFPSPSLSYIVAPFWSDSETGSVDRIRCDHHSVLQEGNGSNTILRDVAKFIKEKEPGVSSFHPTWMVVCEWINITIDGVNPLINTFQGLVITDGTEKSFAVFTYHCNRPPHSDSKLPSVTIGFQAESDFFAVKNIKEVVCINNPRANWSSVIYQLAPRPILSGFTKELHIVIGCVVGGVTLFFIVHILLFSVFCKTSRSKRRRASKNGSTLPLSSRVLGDCGDGLEVPFSALDLQDTLGMGAFGAVYEAVLRNPYYPHRPPRKCAVKLLKDTATETEREALLSEAVLMQSLEPHPHLVRMLGCCTTGDNIALILEFCHHGNLKEFLVRNRKYFQQVSSRRQSGAAALGVPGNIYVYTRTPASSSSVEAEEVYFIDKAAIQGSELSLQEEYDERMSVREDDEEEEGLDLSLHTLLSFGRQITLGMEYLAQKKIVHRDLAARNILVGQDWTLKISDFGLSKDIYEDLYYRASGGKLPVRWMAVEAIIDRQFTTMSDVWSFGVVLWEIVTLGSFPYPEFSNSEVLEKLRTGYRMPKPENCPQCLYELMLNCWNEQPFDRPSFKGARQCLDQVISTTEEAEEYLLLVGSELQTITN